jgi:glucan phosphoethanolaminetransferase (alkaline phosphatase superfamily)
MTSAGINPPQAATIPLTWGDLLLLGAALFIPIVPNVIYLFTSGMPAFWLGQSLTSALLVLAPLLLGLKPRIALACLGPIAIITPVLAAYALVTGYAPSLLALQVMRETTKEELFNYIPGIILCGALGMGIAGFYWHLARRLGPRSLPHRGGVRFLAFSLLLLSLSKDVIGQGPHAGGVILASRLEKMSPLAPIALAIHFTAFGLIIPDRAAVLDRYTVRQQSPAAEHEVCVLIIGESARKNAFGLYDHSVDTNPLLRARQLVVFQDMASCGTATVQSVPILLTGRFPNGEILPFRELGLIEAFRLAGFHTWWLSTQDADGEISSFITAFSNNAQETAFINGRLERSNRRDPDLKFDGTLLDPFAAAIAKPGKHFIVLHTLGSHLPYTRRYPPDFEFWPVEEGARKGMWHWLPPYNDFQRQQILHAYLNTVRYTDWFIDQVIAKLRAAGGVSSVIYLSDHGENQADAPAMPANHCNLSDDVVRIPFFMWFSDAFRTARQPLIASLEANVGKHVSAQDLFSTGCALNGLETPEADPTRNLASASYREHERKVMLLDCSIAPFHP